MVISSAQKEPDKGEAGNRKFHAGSSELQAERNRRVSLIESFPASEGVPRIFLRMSASASPLPEADCLLSLRVSGAARRTKVFEERTRGPQTMVYGYFCFRLSLARSRPAVVNAERDAICRNGRCIGWRWRWGSLARGGFEASLTTDGANSIVGRSEGATAGSSGRPCRVTANASRLTACSAVVRGADASARMSR